MHLKIEHIYSTSEKGNRSYNEDNIYPKQEKNNENLFIVSDGVGGNKYGEIASQLCNHLIKRFFSRNNTTINNRTFDKLFQYIQAGFGQFKKEHEPFRSMATTTAILKLDDLHTAHLAWAGDSRIYYIRNHALHYRTMDHSFSEKLKNELSSQQFSSHAINHIILNGISGQSELEYLEYQQIENIQKKDLFFLCSDGVNDSFEKQELENILCDRKSTFEKKQLIEKHCAAKATDNYSFLLIEV